MAAIKWSQGATHFVIRIDSLGRWWQNEFAQILTDAAILPPADWAVKCWENYEPEDFEPAYEPCGVDGSGVTTLPGGKQVPISLAVVPKQLWTDPPVVTWINDRNNTSSWRSPSTAPTTPTTRLTGIGQPPRTSTGSRARRAA